MPSAASQSDVFAPAHDIRHGLGPALDVTASEKSATKEADPIHSSQD